MKTILYLGTDPAHFEVGDAKLIHYPIIKIVPRSADHPAIAGALSGMGAYTHLIFTSKNAVKVFFQLFPMAPLSKILIAIGKVTAEHLCRYGAFPHFVSEVETQEGIVALLKGIDLSGAYCFIPRSSQSRPVLVQFLEDQKVRYLACDLYDTVTCRENRRPDLDQVDEVIFTSPSTVRAFIEIFGSLPDARKCRTIGPVTQQALAQFTKLEQKSILSN